VTLVLRYFTRSDRGLVRSNNEDSAYAGPRLLALADGMGGHAAGEVASQLVIEALSSLDADEPGGDLLSALDRATHAGNEAIAAQVEQSPELEGMGTTLTAILFAGSRIGLCHIGDSRGYMYRDGEITQITRDDTFVQTLVDEGRITAEQAHTHPQRSLIMRALTGTEVEPTLTVREARAGDRYLLCSDGLSDVVTEETLGETLGSIADPRECADRLIELALRGGGPDNVTVVIGDVVDTEYGDSRPIVGGAAGGHEDSYTPDPKTAAGRAAALRPPPAEPQRPTVLDEPAPTGRRSHLGRWIALGVALVVVAALIIGYFVIRATIYSNYYATATDTTEVNNLTDGNVVIRQGSPEKFLFRTMNRPAANGCIETDALMVSQIVFKDEGQECARTLRLLDLKQATAQSIVDLKIKNLSRDEVENSISGELLPVCQDMPTSTPPPRTGTTTPSNQPGYPGGGGADSTLTPGASTTPTRPNGSPAPSTTAQPPLDNPNATGTVPNTPPVGYPDCRQK